MPKGELVLWSCAIIIWIQGRMKGETEPRTWGNCSVSCHTHSRNWVKIGDTSFGSPSNWSHLQLVNRHSVNGTKRTWPIWQLCLHSSTHNNPCQVFKASPVCKFVTKRDPVFLNQYLKAIKGKISLHHVFHLPHKRLLWLQCYHEALDGAVVGVHEQSPQRADLSCPVPSIWTMDQHAGSFPCHSLASPWKELYGGVWSKKLNPDLYVQSCIETQWCLWHLENVL